MAENTGPIYNVPLINSLPLCSAAPDGMRQAMPNRADLERVNKLSARTAAGYEVLLAHYLSAQAVVDKLPVYADTGKPFIPDKDGAWVIDCQWPDSPPHPAPVVRTYWNYGTAKWAFDIQTPMGSGIRMVYGPAYSCKAAALAAKEQVK